MASIVAPITIMAAAYSGKGGYFNIFVLNMKVSKIKIITNLSYITFLKNCNKGISIIIFLEGYVFQKFNSKTFYLYLYSRQFL